MKKLMACVHICLIAGLMIGVSACSSSNLQLKNEVVSEVPLPIGSVQTKSMGENLLQKYACPCNEIYEVTSDIAFNDYGKIAARGSKWSARYFNPASNEKYLVNASFHPALALVLLPTAPPKLSSEHAVIQIEGGKRGRTWSLVNPGQAGSIRLFSYVTSGKSWSVQYIGQEKGQSQILRFTIEDRTEMGERVGQVEYTHDLRNGREFVVRGVRLRIEDVLSDGRVSYVIVSDDESRG